MLARGEVERVARGIYRRTDAEITELETVAAVSKRVSGSVVCLLTALAIHEIGTQLPNRVWIAIDRKARKPRVHDLPIEIVRFSGPMLSYGVDTIEALGVEIRVTSPARTIVDCFRYRKKIGLDVALEALHDAVETKKVTVAEVDRVARVSRIRSVLRPYLESLAW